MAGLRNREVSPLAFESLLPNVDAFMAIDDVWAHEAMRALANRARRSGDRRRRIRFGGARRPAGALPRRVDGRGAPRSSASIDPSSVLVIVSEGVTDPGLWSRWWNGDDDAAAVCMRSAAVALLFVALTSR